MLFQEKVNGGQKASGKTKKNNTKKLIEKMKENGMMIPLDADADADGP
jgi:hypothetical protein